jgi:hypothetical protein
LGILDGIVEWIATQVMNILDMINTSVLGALGCDMETFLQGGLAGAVGKQFSQGAIHTITGKSDSIASNIARSVYNSSIQNGGGFSTNVISSIAARFDYILNDTPQIGEVDWGEETVVVMENHAKPSIEITKIDAETSEPISGVHFEITHKNTQQTYTGVTDDEGKITFEGVD